MGRWCSRTGADGAAGVGEGEEGECACFFVTCWRYFCAGYVEGISGMYVCLL